MSFWQKSVYPKLPFAFQNMAISAFGYTWNKRRYGGIFEQQLKEFKTRENWNVSQWHAYQTTRLRQLLIHAFETVPYYAEYFQRLGYTTQKLQRFEMEALSSLPFLEKSHLRQFGRTTLLSTRPEPGGEFFESSGSTGTPTSILYSPAMHQRLHAAYESRVRHWAGVDRFMPRSIIGGRRVVPEGNAKPPYYRYNYIEKQLYLSAYHISKDSVRNYVEGIWKYKSEYMTGYAMSNFFLARFILEAGIEAPPMKAVVTSSEKLTPAMREVFQKAYGCKTFDGWSGVENCGLISESEFGQLLISPDVGIIEIIDRDGLPVKPGQSGEVVCTGFLNFDQPLIRYKIGDYVTLAENQTTQCGRSMPVIEEIVGRMEDVVVGKDGREMVRFHGVFYNLSSVVEAQLVQQAVDVFLVNVVPVNKLSETDKALIMQRLQSQLGPLKITFQELREIPRGSNGKFKAVISTIARKV
jgi:phenylacetate-CoA ligase